VSISTENNLLRLCGISDVSDGWPLRCEAGTTAYAVFKLEEEYFVIADACTHGPGSLSEGYVEGSEVECPFHRGHFNIRTGCPTSAPCTVPVQTWKVQVIDEYICIDPGETGGAPAVQNLVIDEGTGL
jgi:nitrite reductase/ring-hydroxylating ferredoxin subunit